jgi:surfeit locus 1 family protein
MSRYRFALRPKWILSHLFVLALVVGMLWAASWQVDRLHQKQARNRRISARTVMPAVPVGTLSTAGSSFDTTDPIEFRNVTATGTYLRDQELLVRSRSQDGDPGSWVLTPLDLGHGAAVVVNRGWIPNDGRFHTVPSRFRAPSGTVTVTGFVRKTETRGRFGPRDPKTGTLSDLARADVARLDQQVPERLLPLYLQLRKQDPALKPTDPEVVPKPEQDEGPHKSYAIQWLIFTTVALVGYPLILRRRAREIERGDEDEDFDPDGPDPTDVPAPDDPRLDAAEK